MLKLSKSLQAFIDENDIKINVYRVSDGSKLYSYQFGLCEDATDLMTESELIFDLEDVKREIEDTEEMAMQEETARYLMSCNRYFIDMEHDLRLVSISEVQEAWSNDEEYDGNLEDYVNGCLYENDGGLFPVANDVASGYLDETRLYTCADSIYILRDLWKHTTEEVYTALDLIEHGRVMLSHLQIISAGIKATNKK